MIRTVDIVNNSVKIISTKIELKPMSFSQSIVINT